jgi:hypothetical protein
MLHTLALPLSMTVFASEAAFDVLFANVDDRYLPLLKNAKGDKGNCSRP